MLTKSGKLIFLPCYKFVLFSKKSCFLLFLSLTCKWMKTRWGRVTDPFVYKISLICQSLTLHCHNFLLGSGFTNEKQQLLKSQGLISISFRVDFTHSPINNDLLILKEYVVDVTTIAFRKMYKRFWNHQPFGCLLTRPCKHPHHLSLTALN